MWNTVLHGGMAQPADPTALQTLQHYTPPNTVHDALCMMLCNCVSTLTQFTWHNDMYIFGHNTDTLEHMYVYIFYVPTLATWMVIKIYVHCGIRRLETVCSSPTPKPMHQITWIISQKTITNCQFIVNTDTLIFWNYTWQTEYLLSQQKQQLPGLQ
jgi:hypothetical protein